MKAGSRRDYRNRSMGPWLPEPKVESSPQRTRRTLREHKDSFVPFFVPLVSFVVKPLIGCAASVIDLVDRLVGVADGLAALGHGIRIGGAAEAAIDRRQIVEIDRHRGIVGAVHLFQ